MTEDDKDLLKRLLDDELLSLKTVEETGNRLKELIAENERLRDALSFYAHSEEPFGDIAIAALGKPNGNAN